MLHTTCTISNISKVLQEEQQGLKQHKYNETSLGGLAIKKQGVEEMAKLVLEEHDICLEQESFSLRQ